MVVDFTKFKKINVSHITVITKSNKESIVKKTMSSNIIKPIKPMVLDPFIKPIFNTI